MGLEVPLIPVDDRTQPPFLFGWYMGAGARQKVKISIDDQNRVHLFDGRYLVHKI